MIAHDWGTRMNEPHRRTIGAGVTIVGLLVLSYVLFGPTASPPLELDVADRGEVSAIVVDAQPSLRTSSRPSRRVLDPADQGDQAGSAAVIRGRVLSAAMRPAPGTRVTATCAGEVLGVAVTDKAGRFRFDADVPDAEAPVTALIEARDGTGHMALGGCTLRPSDWWIRPRSGRWGDAGTLILRPTQVFRVLVTAEGVVFGPIRIQVIHESRWSRAIPCLDVEARVGEPLALDPLPEGIYLIVATAAGLGRETSGVSLPSRSVDPVRIHMGKGHGVDVMVVASHEGTPIRGAKVTLNERTGWGGRRIPQPEIALTDANGRTRIEGLGEKERLTVLASADGYTKPHAEPEGVRLRPGDRAVRVPLSPLRTCSWPVVAGASPIPREGSLIHIVPRWFGRTAVPRTGRMEAGRVVVAGLGWGFVNLVGEAEDGSMASLLIRGDGNVGKEVSFSPLRTLVVSLKHADQSPVPGVLLSAAVTQHRDSGTPRRTDSEGKVVFSGLLAGPGTVYLTPWRGRPDSGERLAAFDLSKGDAALEVTVPRTRSVIARITVAGKPGVPAGTIVRLGREEAEPADIDVEAGEVTFSWQPARPRSVAWLTAWCSGHREVSAKVSAADDADPLIVSLPLELAGELHVLVKPGPDLRPHLQAQRWDAKKRRWLFASTDTNPGGSEGPALSVDPSGTARARGLVAGTYRFIDKYTQITTPSVVVVPGAEPRTVNIDLSHSRLVRGIVMGPDGNPVRGAKVRVTLYAGEVGEEAPRSLIRPAAPDGQFRTMVPGDRPVVLEALHSQFRAAPDGGRVRIHEPEDGVVLHLTRGPVAAVHVDRTAGGLSVAALSGGVPVWLFEDEQGPHAIQLEAIYDGRVVRFGGYRPGHYTIWLDVDPYAPIVLENVELGKGETDLGSAAPSSGASVVLTVLSKEGKKPPPVQLSARRIGTPTYTRYVRKAGAEVRLSGLGAGRFQVYAYSEGASRTRLLETVEVDGVVDVELTLDLR